MFFNVAMAAVVPESRVNEEMNVLLPDFVCFFFFLKDVSNSSLPGGDKQT